MGKRKIAIYGLIALAIILCMMTIYMQMQNNKLRITNNRVEGDYETLKNDYEKLYAAYYSYDKKILEILFFLDTVYWAEDSSAYMVSDGTLSLFSFYHKPAMQKECNIWLRAVNHDKTTAYLGNKPKIFYKGPRIDQLKPHQFQFIKQRLKWIDAVMVAGIGPSENYPDTNNIVTTIKIKYNELRPRY